MEEGKKNKKLRIIDGHQGLRGENCSFKGEML